MKKFPDEGFLYILDNHEQLYGFPVLKHEKDGIHDVSIPVCNFILMSNLLCSYTTCNEKKCN